MAGKSLEATLYRYLPVRVAKSIGALVHLPRNAYHLLLIFPALYFQQTFLGRPILFIRRHAGMGDIICTFPSVGTLKRRHPRSIVVYATRTCNASMVRQCSHVDVVIQEEGSVLPKLLRTVLDPKMVFYPTMPDEGGQQVKRQDLHLTDEFRESFGLDAVDEQTTRLNVPPRELLEVKRQLEGENLVGKSFVVIHTGPTWKVREWPEEKWRQLVAELQAQCSIAVIQIGEDATSFGDFSLSPRVPAAINWIGRLTLDQTLALLSVANLFVGLDSGVLHLAGAIHCPCVGIFGPTLSSLRLPRNDNAIGVAADVPCLGCHHELPQGHWRDGCPHDIRCMAELSVETVLAACVKLLRPEMAPSKATP